MTNDVYGFGEEQARRLAEIDRRVLGTDPGSRVGQRDTPPELAPVVFDPVEIPEPGKTTSAVLIDWVGNRTKTVDLKAVEALAFNSGRRGLVTLPQRYMAVLVDTLPEAADRIPTGTISASSTSLATSSDLRPYKDDYTLVIVGAGADGSDLVTTIASATEDTATLDDEAETAVTDADLLIMSVADAWLVYRDVHGRLQRRRDADDELVTVPVVNRFQHIELLPNTLIGIEWLGEWQPYKMDCEPGTFGWESTGGSS